jgi:hypothetical protein
MAGETEVLGENLLSITLSTATNRVSGGMARHDTARHGTARYSTARQNWHHRMKKFTSLVRKLRLPVPDTCF